ncbi:MAG TPA: mechanosensitive ion channel domain-containing protein [Gemmatimonadales bacterium]|nr:mechanosensitive ion channel domain-containing protein [Gemmatimonadales bacterium]
MAITPLLLALLLPSIQAPAADTAVLQLGNRTVAVFRSRGTAPTAAARAAAVGRRVKAELAAGRDSVSSQALSDGVLILLGGEPAFMVTVADVDTAAGESMTAVAARVVTEMRLVIRESRESRSPRRLLTEGALFLVATLMLVLAVRLLGRARQRVSAALEPRLVAATRRIGIRGLTILEPHQVVAAERALVAALWWGLVLVVTYGYLTFVLSLFPWTRPWGETLGEVLLASLGRVGLAALEVIPNLAILVLIFIATRYAARLVRTVFIAVAQRRIALPGIHPDTAEPTRRIIVVLLWMFAIVVAYPYVPGSGSTAFKGISVITGVLFTLGSAGIVGQAMSGLVLMYSRSFRVGDFIQTGGMQGTVIELGLLATQIRTPKNEFVTLPNNVVVAGAVTDYTAASRQGVPLLIYSSVTIGYDTPWRQVHELLIAAAGKAEAVLTNPAPFVLQTALDDSYVEYQLNAAIDAERSGELPWIYAGLRAAIQDTFWAAGVEIMSPTYHAVRDGNTVTIPVEQRPKQRAPAFRVDVNPSP